MLRLYVWAFLAFLYAPILLLPVFAFNDGTVIAFPLDGFTTAWFARLTENGELHAALGNSLIVAASASVLSVLLGLAAARASTRYRWPGRAGMMGLVMLPLVLPEIIVAVSLLVVAVQVLGLSLSLWMLVAAHTLICTPFAVAILNASFAALDPAIEEAAVDLGETRASTFLRVTLPLVAPGIVAAALISFTISLDEFIIAFFLTGSDPTLPVYLWSQLRFPARIPIVMALGTILVALSIALIVVAELYRRRGLRRAGLADTGGHL